LFGTAEDDPQTKAAKAVFIDALHELGWIEGRNFRIDYRWAAANLGRMQSYAKELVGLRPDAILAHTTQSVAALQRETKTIPIVFVVVSDSVGSGFIASLSHPGGNITGFINVEASLSSKWIELLKSLAPGTSRAALMFNPETAPYFNYYLAPFEIAARSNAIQVIAAEVRSTADIERALTSLGNRPGAGLVVMPDAFMINQRNYDPVVSLAARSRIPAIYPNRYMVDAGGLASYGVDNIDIFRRAPAYIDRILKGATPAGLPVQLPTKFIFVLNLKVAKELDLTVPPSLFAIADETIE
jgi:putative tryptophan/tyrosine transport system substrate-binding protein